MSGILEDHQPNCKRSKRMATVREKTTVVQRIHGSCPTHSRTEIAVRDVKSVKEDT